jgi:hypothetical protein
MTGIGSRRIELSEQNIFLNNETVFYKAPSHRRASTIGPGASLAEDDTENEVDSSGSVERNEHRRSFRRLSADLFQRRRSRLSRSSDSSVAMSPQGQVTPPDGGGSGNSTGEVNGRYNHCQGKDTKIKSFIGAQESPAPMGDSSSPSRRDSTPLSLPELPGGKLSRRLSVRLTGVIKDVKHMMRRTDSRQDHTTLSESTPSSQGPQTASPDKGEGHRGRSRDRIGKRMSVIGEALGLGDEKPSEGDGWHTFRSGTYNYPVSFQLPSTLPPSIQCDFGSVHYRLRATVHRPGSFSHRLTTTVPIDVICMPDEEDADDGDAIVVERQWDINDHPQLRYLLSIGGRHFTEGSEIQWNIRLMPLNKVKLYRITIILEGKQNPFPLH